MEYPGFPRHHVWYVNETIAANAAIWSPIFDLDRHMGIHSGRAAGTGATSAGNPDHLLRTIPIGTGISVHLAETSGLLFSNPVLYIYGSCTNANNPLTGGGTITLGAVAIATGGVLALEGFVGFPWIQCRIFNGDEETGASICGAIRIHPRNT